MELETKIWECTVCGYIHDGDEAPDKCPKCASPKDKFRELKDDEAQKLANSRNTNEIHMEILTALTDIQNLAYVGIEENLDPNCVAIFKRCQKDSTELIQAIKAEMKGHMQKGKWG